MIRRSLGVHQTDMRRSSVPSLAHGCAGRKAVGHRVLCRRPAPPAWAGPGTPSSAVPCSRAPAPLGLSLPIQERAPSPPSVLACASCGQTPVFWATAEGTTPPSTTKGHLDSGQHSNLQLHIWSQGRQLTDSLLHVLHEYHGNKTKTTRRTAPVHRRSFLAPS